MGWIWVLANLIAAAVSGFGALVWMWAAANAMIPTMYDPRNWPGWVAAILCLLFIVNAIRLLF